MKISFDCLLINTVIKITFGDFCKEQEKEDIFPLFARYPIIFYAELRGNIITEDIKRLFFFFSCLGVVEF